MDRMRPRPEPEREQPAVQAQPLAEVRDVAALPDALSRALNVEDRSTLLAGLAAANATHPLLHAKGHVASYVGGEFVITDLSAKRPSLPDDRFAKVRALAELDKGERARIDVDVAVARAAGRFSSWPELMKAWDAADVRKDANAVLLCAACFALYDDLRKSFAQPEKNKEQPAERPAPARREDPSQNERRPELPKVQASMLARYRALPDDEKARLRRHPLPRKLTAERFPFTQDHLLEEWQRFTAASIERFKQTKTQSEPDNDDQLRFAALYAGLDRRAARSQQELMNVAIKQLGGTPPTETTPSAPAPAPSAPAASPATSPLTTSWEGALERARRHLDSEERVRTVDLKRLVSEAAILFGTGADPRTEARLAYEAGSKLDKNESGRSAATQKLYGAALVALIPAPQQVVFLGAQSLKRDFNPDAEVERAASAPKASAVEELVAGAGRPANGADVTPGLVHSRLRADYANAFLELRFSRQRPDWQSSADDNALMQKTWLLAHAVHRAARALPTDWQSNADDIFNS